MGLKNPNREYLPIPANLTPQDFVCFCIFIPDNVEHFAVFWGALSALGERYSWGTPLTAESEIVAEYWFGIIAENRLSFDEAIRP